MRMRWLIGLATLTAMVAPPAVAQDEVRRLAEALRGATPMIADLRVITDSIGGRATLSASNVAAVAWGVRRFREAGLTAQAESFVLPVGWLERSATASVGGGASFAPRIAAMPYSVGTPAAGLTAPLLDAGKGAEADFARLGAAVRGAWVLVEQDLLKDIDGLFAEYAATAEIERRAWAAGAAGVVYQASRADGLLYRHNAALGWDDRKPAVVMERAAAGRALRLLRAGVPLRLTAQVSVDRRIRPTASNVVAEIRGATKPDEIVVVGAHLDSWDLGTGALDNGANCAMLLDVARQMVRLGLRPARTIRFVLWNGEEQGMLGSWGYTVRHAAELDRTVLSAAFDIGTGAINGFFTGGRQDVMDAVGRALEPVRDLGTFAQANVPIVGTDNYDFMMLGVPNVVANQEAATYGPNYHAASDTFDKADTVAMRRNAAIAGAVAWYWANAATVPGRHGRAQVDELVRTSDLRTQMHIMGGLLEDFEAGRRPRRE
jgi:carboxypeptidase Q